MTAGLRERYRSAVHATSLTVDERTTFSNTDVLGAMGLADRVLTEGKRWSRSAGKDGKPKTEAVKPAPLAAMLERLFSGDNRAAHEIVQKMAEMAFERSFALRLKVSRPVTHDMACSVLAWSRNGRCKPCNGHGKTLVHGTGERGYGGVLSERDCDVCKGTGWMEFDRHFQEQHRELAWWLLNELERAMGRAGPEAMRSLAKSMDF